MINRRRFIGLTTAILSAGISPCYGRLQMPSTNEYYRFQLRDGRFLGFATYGDPNGWPVLYFHGNPTSRLEAKLYDAAARQNGCRLISLDRPGYGLSDPQPGRSICHWTRDMNEFINATNHPVFLDLQQFSVASFSSGSAYALACAAHLPETRLKSVAVISGVAPLARVCGNGGYSARAYRLAHRFPNFATTLLNRNARQVVRAPKRVIHRISRFFCPPDRKVFCDPLATRMLIESFLDSVRCGPEGVVHDLSLLSQPWGFSNVCINRPVSLWYGSCDLTVPANSMGDYLNRALPNSRLSLIPGEGHISMLKNAGNAVFRQLMLDRTL